MEKEGKTELALASRVADHRGTLAKWEVSRKARQDVNSPAGGALSPPASPFRTPFPQKCSWRMRHRYPPHTLCVVH